jgi:hypothetical protein
MEAMIPNDWPPYARALLQVETRVFFGQAFNGPEPVFDLDLFIEALSADGLNEADDSFWKRLTDSPDEIKNEARVALVAGAHRLLEIL